MTPEFKEFAKVPRLYRDVVITEKIDGTNGLIAIESIDRVALEGTVGVQYDLSELTADPTVLYIDADFDVETNTLRVVRAGSRSRWLTRKTDNFGFAKWVQENAGGLLALGEGNHYGEWWGSGVQRGYGLTGGDKRFSLFNTGRWFDPARNGGSLVDPDGFDRDPVPDVPGLSLVPVLYRGALRAPNGSDAVAEALRRLSYSGSLAAPGFANAEGVMVYHEAAKHYFKATLEGDQAKGSG